MRHRLCATLAAALLHAPQHAQGVAKSVECKDPEVTREELKHCDATHFEAAIADNQVRFTVTMHEPIAAGMFTCLHVHIDGDDDANTGIAGAELWLRGAVGSRFHPNAWKSPMAGIPSSMDLIKGSYSTPTQMQGAGGDQVTNWLHHEGEVSLPQVDGKKLSFRVPLGLLRRHMGRYNTAVALYASVETSCSDQPIDLDHSCGDAGIKVVVDGKTEEWTGGRGRSDPGDELHPCVSFLDLVQARLDHDAGNIFAAIKLQSPGFPESVTQGTEIWADDSVSLLFIPLGVAYQKPGLVKLRSGSDRFEGDSEEAGVSWSAAASGNTIEVAFGRRAGQNKMRVLVWSDAIRRDRIPDAGWLRLEAVR